MGNSKIENEAFFKLSYGLFVLTAYNCYKNSGCVINSLIQVTDSPKRICISVNKGNFTESMIRKSGKFNISVLSEKTDFKLIERFGYSSGRDKDKFNDFSYYKISENGIRYITLGTNAYLSCTVINVFEIGTHSVFFAEVTEAKTISDDKSLTYSYYLDKIKPTSTEKKSKGFVCKICGYVYEGEELPPDFVCPICKHGVEDFEKII